MEEFILAANHNKGVVNECRCANTPATLMSDFCLSTSVSLGFQHFVFAVVWSQIDKESVCLTFWFEFYTVPSCGPSIADYKQTTKVYV